MISVHTCIAAGLYCTSGFDQLFYSLKFQFHLCSVFLRPYPFFPSTPTHPQIQVENRSQDVKHYASSVQELKITFISLLSYSMAIVSISSLFCPTLDCDTMMTMTQCVQVSGQGPTAW